MKEAAAELREAGVEHIWFDHKLADYTTWKIGGPADLFVLIDKKEQLINTMKILNHLRIPWMQIGRGSNMLISDKGFRGVVIKLGPAFEFVRFDGDSVCAGGAFSFIKLSVLAAKQGLSGLEFAGGIPGSVGGAVYMNAGAHGSDVSRIIKSAEVVLETGEMVNWGPEELQHAYRYSRLQKERGIVTEAVFQLKEGNRKEIAAAMAAFKERRLKTQPLQSAVAGSVFRNPPGDYAARLIEASDLKGMRHGGAVVSDLHANFIINTGDATAADVLALIDKIRQTVKEDHGVTLETEVLLVGER